MMMMFLGAMMKFDNDDVNDDSDDNDDDDDDDDDDDERDEADRWYNSSFFTWWEKSSHRGR